MGTVTHPPFFDNRANIMKDDLVTTIEAGDRVSVAAEVFSMDAYQELKDQLDGLDEFRFIFTSQAFTKGRTKKQAREFYIPCLSRESGLYGTRLEIRLRNELTQKSVASECARWIRRRARFKSFGVEDGLGNNFLVVDKPEGEPVAYLPFNGFTTTELGVEADPGRQIIIAPMEGEAARSFLGNFDQAWGSGELADVTDAVASIVGAKEESDVDSFFGGGMTGFLENDIPGARRLRADLLFGGEVQMLGLPSTTEVGRRLPKEAFYRHLTLDAKIRRSFVDDIGAITVANSIKTATLGLADGEAVHEIMVVRLDLKGDAEPTGAIGAIAAANPHRLVFRCEPNGRTYVVRRGLQASDSIDALTLTGESLDEAWDSICAQVAFGDTDGRDIDGRLVRAKCRAALEAEISDLDARCRKARQINRRNELFAELKRKQQELEKLREERDQPWATTSNTTTMCRPSSRPYFKASTRRPNAQMPCNWVSTTASAGLFPNGWRAAGGAREHSRP